VTSPANPDHAGQPARWPRALWVAALAVLAGAAFLAITRADALMLDVTRIVGCF